MRTIAALLVLSALCASVNLTKAVHVDDTSYLATAAAIREDPFHPMSGSINWEDTRRPIHELNQPLLWPIAMALVTYVSGGSELALHCFMALISGAVVFLFFAIARRLIGEQALFVTALLVLGPAFLPGQNLMVDVPLLALWLFAFYGLLRAWSERRPLWYGASAAAIGAACLVKYTSLALLPVFACLVVSRRDKPALRFLLIPLLMLAAWSAFNLFDYGGIHLLQRRLEPLPGTYADRLLEWVAGLGAIATFTLAYLPHGAARRRSLAVASGIGLGVTLISARGPTSDWQLALLWGIFAGSGVLTLSLALRAAWRAMTDVSDARSDAALLLTLWLVAAFTFVVSFAPFIAVRHVLLAVPPILLLLTRGGAQPSYRRRALTLFATASLGFLLACSDYQLADLYRQQAKRIRRQLPARATIWYVGHWGWQWYAEKEGMLQYDTEATLLSVGDFVIVPALAHRQHIPYRDQRRLHREWESVVTATPASWLRTMSASPWGGYYAYWFRLRSTPWRFSLEPLETFTVFRVGHEPESPGEVARRF
jgi:4-amino-4-deoxy-L-arabinose transferase-like glycosyltransferase